MMSILTSNIPTPPCKSDVEDPSFSDERLPLYQEVNDTNTTLPPNDASPSEVREFLFETLVRRSRVDQDVARQISDKWTIGTGKELRTYPVKLYCEIFGSEAAWNVYQLVRTMALEEERAESGAPPQVGIAVCYFIFAVFLGLFVVALATERVVLGLVSGGLGLISFFAAIGVSMDACKTPEATVSEELKNAFKNGSGSESERAHASQGSSSSA